MINVSSGWFQANLITESLLRLADAMMDQAPVPLFLFSTDENWQSCNNPLTGVQACFTADSAAVFTSEATTTSGSSIMSSPRPNVELSSQSFLCNPRSKVPGKREWILRSNKHTFSDGRNWTHFSLSSFCRLAHSLHWKIDLAMIARGLSHSRTHRKIGLRCLAGCLMFAFNPCFHAPQSNNCW